MPVSQLPGRHRPREPGALSTAIVRSLGPPGTNGVLPVNRREHTPIVAVRLICRLVKEISPMLELPGTHSLTCNMRT